MRKIKDKFERKLKKRNQSLLRVEEFFDSHTYGSKSYKQIFALSVGIANIVGTFFEENSAGEQVGWSQAESLVGLGQSILKKEIEYIWTKLLLKVNLGRHTPSGKGCQKSPS